MPSATPVLVPPAFTRRPALLLLGVLLLQLAFIGSYIGAFHQPRPRNVPVAVVPVGGVDQTAALEVAQALDDLPGHPLEPTVEASRADAQRLVDHADIDAWLEVGTGPTYQLKVASAEGAALAEAVSTVMQDYAANVGRGIDVTDVRPPLGGDARGLSAFYLAIGWVVGGYLAAAVLGVTMGGRAPTRHRALWRLGGLAAYSVLGGLGGALMAGPVIGALDSHVLAVAAFGALLLFATGAATLALQTWLGIAGVGVAVILFVVIGNPSAGGAYPTPMLPAFWANVGPWLPPGAGTSGIRGIVYFLDAGLGKACLALGIWAVAGGVLTLLGSGEQAAEADVRAL